MPSPELQFFDTQAGDRQRAAQDIEAAKPKPTFGDALSAAWRTETMIDSAVHSYVGQQFVPDPAYRVTPESFKELTEGIPKEHHSAFVRSHSAAHAQWIRDSIMSELEDRRTVGAAGGAGFGAVVLASVADPLQLAASAVGLPAGYFAKADRLRRFMAGGMVAGGTNAAVEAYLQNEQYTRDPGDVITSALLGFGLGGGLSALSRAENASLRRIADEGVKRKDLGTLVELVDPADLTPAARALDDKVSAPAEYYRGTVLTAEQSDKMFIQSLRSEFRAQGEAFMRDNFPNRGAPVPDIGPPQVPLPARGPLNDPLPDSIAVTEAERLASGAGAKARAALRAEADTLKVEIEDLLSGKRTVATPDAPEGPTRGDTAALTAYRKAAGAEAPEPTAMQLAFLKARGASAKKMKMADIEARLAAGPDPLPPTASVVGQRAGVPGSQQRAREFDRAQSQAADKKMDEMQGIETRPVDPPEAAPQIGPITAGDQVFWTAKNGAHRSGIVSGVDEATGFLRVVDDETGKSIKLHKQRIEDEDPLYPSYAKPGERSSFVPGGSAGAAQGTLLAPDKTRWSTIRIPFTNIEIPTRFDYFALIDRSKNELHRNLARDLIDDAVGTAEGAAQRLTASAYSDMLKGTYRARFYSASREQFGKYAARLGLNHIQAAKGELKFFEDITAIARGDNNLATRNPEAAVVAAEVGKIHTDIIALMKKHGVAGAEDIIPDPYYMMRRFNHNRLANLVDTFGDSEVAKLVAGAMQAVRTIPMADALRTATAYLKTVRALRYDHSLQRATFSLEDHAVLRRTLESQGIAPTDIENVIQLMRAATVDTTGTHPRLKNRTAMDENFTMRIADKNGNMVQVSTSDLFEGDSRLLVDLYAKQTSGLIGLARVGIRSESDWTTRLKEANAFATENLLDPAEHAKTVKYLEDIHSHILGRPTSADPFGKGERVGRLLRDINFTRLMGQAGFAQVAEIGNLIGLAGWRAVSHHLPAVGDFTNLVRGRLIDDQLAKDVMHIGGFGAEVMGSHPQMREIEDQVFDKSLSKVEAVAQQAKYYTSHLSGLHAINNTLRQVTARAFVQRFADIAASGAKLDDAVLKRLANAGLDDSNIDDVLAHVRKYTDLGPTGGVTGIRWEDWHAANSETADLFRMAVWRESRRAVQEHTVGETAPWMHSTIGKILTQFRSFTLVAYSKQLLHGLNHMDANTATAWLMSTTFAGLAYTVQTGINFAHNEKQLERRLRPEEIAKAAFQRSGFASLIPAAVDTSLMFATGDSVFNYGRTTGLGTGLITGNPSVDFVSTKLIGTLSNMSQSFLSDDHMWTKKDVKNGMGLFVPNVLLARNLVDAVSQEFPERNFMKEQRPRQ